MSAPNQPSMEDILASIKKVIAEEKEFRASPRAENDSDEEVLELDRSMEEEPVDGTGHDPAAPSAEEASLMAEEAAGTSRAKLEELAGVAASAPAAAAGNPLEEMVREMLRPMLKAWLDEKLPGIVDDHVRREISRITGRKL